MSIQLTKQHTNRPAFKQRVRLTEPNNLVKGLIASAASSGSSASASASGIASTTSAATTGSHLLGSGAGIAGSAFSAKAAGLNSSGIVPSVMHAAAPYATPATVAFANAHPSIMGSFFSAVGAFFHKIGGFHVSAKVKTPSKEVNASSQEHVRNFMNNYKSNKNLY